MASRAIRAESAQSNVVRLPTAAPRKVEQPSGPARQAYRQANPWPGQYRSGFERRCQSLAESLTAAELIALAALVSLPDDQRKAAAANLTRLWFCSDNATALRAADIAVMAMAGRIPG